MINTKMNPVEFAEYVTNLGAGEILINSIDRDGTLLNYDTNLGREVKNQQYSYYQAWWSRFIRRY